MYEMHLVFGAAFHAPYVALAFHPPSLMILLPQRGVSPTPMADHPALVFVVGGVVGVGVRHGEVDRAAGQAAAFGDFDEAIERAVGIENVVAVVDEGRSIACAVDPERVSGVAFDEGAVLLEERVQRLGIDGLRALVAAGLGVADARKHQDVKDEVGALDGVGECSEQADVIGRGREGKPLRAGRLLDFVDVRVRKWEWRVV